MAKTFVTWARYFKHLETLEDKLLSGISVKSQVIVGLTRGGLVPAVYLSHSLGFPMVAFDPHLLHTSGEEREPITLPISPAITKSVLIVDDISDTGKTFTKCDKFFSNRGFNCITLSVYINSETTTFIPDYYADNSERRWVVFPYEKE